jgi:nucleotide-binding universal stress UspA family protein
VNPELSPYFALPVGSAPQLTYDIIEDAKAYLEQLRTNTSLDGITVETHVFLGLTAPALQDAITETKADIVIMCSHGRVGFARWALGSVAQHIARHAPVPVLILREGKPLLLDASAERGYPLRALVALDGSRLAEEVLPHAVAIFSALTGENGGELHLISVVSPFDLEVAGITEPIAVAAAKRYLESIVDRLHADNAAMQLRITSDVVVSRDIAGYLIGTALEAEDLLNTEKPAAPATAPDELHQGYDLMAMATHGRTGFALWSVGSVTERVLQSTQLPLLIVRPKHVPTEIAKPVEATIPATRELEDEISSWPGLL